MLLTEDEDDIFGGGSPRGKFTDIIFNANRNLVQEELDSLLERIAIYEMIMEEKLGIDDFERDLITYKIEKSGEVESRRINLYLESVANILSKNE